MITLPSKALAAQRLISSATPAALPVTDPSVIELPVRCVLTALASSGPERITVTKHDAHAAIARSLMDYGHLRETHPVPKVISGGGIRTHDLKVMSLAR